jgi:cytochrome d ubiquinol oxidase subunit II
MELQITWFILWAVLWAVYFMLDGFALGMGMLSGILGKSETDRRMLLRTVGPVWNGNEVWLVTAGGATFAAFPTTYALMFSYLYTALLLLLFSLIIRGVSFEFREKADTLRWRLVCDAAIVVSSFLPALLFGVAFGNIFRGLAMDQTGYHGSFVSLLNPYGLLTGALFVLLFAVHGALYVSVKTAGALSGRGQETARRLWPWLLVVAVVFLGASKFATRLFDNYLQWPALGMIPLIAVAALIAIRYFVAHGVYGLVRDDPLCYVHRGRGALPQPDPLQHRPGVQSDDFQFVVQPVHAGRDDGCRVYFCSHRDRLQDLGVSGVPRPGRGKGCFVQYGSVLKITNNFIMKEVCTR